MTPATPTALPAARPPLVRLPWHEVAEVMLSAHRLVLLVGDPGGGKTTWALEAARRLTGREAEVVQGRPETTGGHLWGTKELDRDGTRFQDGPAARALKSGGVLLIEEMNLIPLETRAALLGLRGMTSLRNPENETEILPVPPTFRLVATSNLENLRCHRNGRVAQALYDDFLMLEVPVPTEDLLGPMIERDFPSSSPEDRAEALTYWRRLARVVDESDNKLGLFLGYRSVAHFLALRAAGLPVATAVQIAYVNKYLPDRDAHQAAKFRASLEA